MLFNATLTEAQAAAVPLDPTADRSSNAYFARCHSKNLDICDACSPPENQAYVEQSVEPVTAP